MLSKRKTALIHVAKKQLDLTDVDYREILQRAAGVASSRDLNDAGFEHVVDELELLGFRSSAARQDFGRARHPTMASGRQIAFIRDLFRAYTDERGTDANLDTFLRHKFHVDALRFLDRPTAQKAITALKSMAQRKADGASKGDRHAS